MSGNPFGGSGNKVLNDEWKGRRNERKGDVRSSLTAARGSRVRNVVDQFEVSMHNDSNNLSTIEAQPVVVIMVVIGKGGGGDSTE